MQIPSGAQAYISGSFYKIGHLMKPFYWVAGEWKLSSKSAASVAVKRYETQYAIKR
jgi:hypothetical protein